MRVKVDLTLCQGYANCLYASPEVFDLGDDGLAILLQEEPPAALEDSVREAARLCPAQAIVVESDGGAS